jgi:menaquinone-dependent protoporphyrinogen IX oxidase
MKTLICYKTHKGATKKYAEWLAEETQGEVKTFNEVPRGETFEGFDQIIVSSGTYAGLMPLNRFLKRHWKNLEGKKVVVVAVGAAPAEDPWSLRSYNMIPEKIREKIAYFKIMGGDPSQKPIDMSGVKKNNLKPVLLVLT